MDKSLVAGFYASRDVFTSLPLQLCVIVKLLEFSNFLLLARYVPNVVKRSI